MIEINSIHTLQAPVLREIQLISNVVQQGIPHSSLISQNFGGAQHFSTFFKQGLSRIDEQQRLAQLKQDQVIMEESDDLVGAMLESQKASITFSALIEVRNKLTSAVEQLINTPV